MEPSIIDVLAAYTGHFQQMWTKKASCLAAVEAGTGKKLIASFHEQG
ncbi:hypothetical protein NDK47_10170 [Brevibacillus ruminantium]|uniref:Uncharacterized protein n=1 Tax=Brevibacillus ruminantium TaxID=2950604 RepID=A0ABY4WKD7_9BACL|nr:hypothetical protein [Brevibacillus ruminantium]USG67611.1 hypothetical protein NDK47_10170 [Brevibacillus ruminantium]